MSTLNNMIEFEDYKDNQLFNNASDHELLLELVKNQAKHEKTADSMISKLEAENMKKDVKLQNCIPVGLIIYLLSFVGVMVFCVTAYVFQLISTTKLVDYYVLTFVFLAAFFLMCTTIKSIGEWRKFLSNAEE